jgi:hypothetical protein
MRCAAFASQQLPDTDTLPALSQFSSLELVGRMPWQRAIPWLLFAALGCTGSRWAREDPDYAAKYPHHTRNLARMTKQAFDARHVKGKGGPYAGLAGGLDNFALGGEAGVFSYPTSYAELHGGFAGLIHEGEHPLSIGLIGGARLQSPSRLAPFAGAGAYGGLTPGITTNDNGYDNDHDGQIDEWDEDERDLVAGVFPEAGVHFWLTPDWRLTAAASYMMLSSNGPDLPMYSMSLARINHPDGPTSIRGKAQAAADGGWQVGDGANPGEYPSTTDFAAEAFDASPPQFPPLPTMDENGMPRG